MKIFFGLSFDDPVFPVLLSPSGGTQYLGQQGLLYFLEAHLGLIGHPSDNEYLRIEQYRQYLAIYLSENPNVFFVKAFEADQFATAIDLLSRRDELLLSGWDFDQNKNIPARLKVLADVESLIRQPDAKGIAAGWADRFDMVLRKLKSRTIPLQELYHKEPFELLPTAFQRLFQQLQLQNIKILPITEPESSGNSDLAAFQALLYKQVNEKTPKKNLQGDGSLLLIKGKRETDLASYLAQLLCKNPIFKPLCLLHDKSRSLEEAMIHEGLPSLGIASASLARPSLQVLKLVTVFLWNPVDPFKVMEFVSLATKPLEEELANQIAVQIAQTPGLKGEGWNIMLARYFEGLEQRATHDKSLSIDEIRRQYRFWFERKRFDIQKTVPKEEVLSVFQYLTKWAFECFEDSEGENSSLLVLSEQARKIYELLLALPEDQLTHLELERIVRTIYEPAPAQLTQPQKGHLPYILHPSSFCETTEELLWWNFSQLEPDHFFSRWYGSERNYLHALGCQLATPATENALLIWQRRQPVIFTKKRLILVLPEQVNGSFVQPYPLLSDLEAHFSNLETITLDLDKEKVAQIWDKCFELPQKQSLQNRRLGQPQPFIKIQNTARFGRREEETFSSLSALFYYPYQWVFRYKIRLKKSPILSVVPDQTLMGNLAHRFFEKLLQQDISKMDKTAVEQWIDQQQHRLLEREGAVLLMYGREPERVGFIQRLKFAAWSLVELIQRNGWEVLQTEQSLEGHFLEMPINGRADLVLQRANELAVIDLKWRGAGYRERSIRNEEDLQLVLYSNLLTNDEQWAHTAYFIMESGKMIARNELAFEGIRAISKTEDHEAINERILERMKLTYSWRITQLKEGKIEVRCEQTKAVLDEEYGAELLELLEMKSEDAYFDDYRTLINLID